MRREEKPGWVGALAQWLVTQTGAEAARLDQVRPLQGGAIQENWLLAVEFSGGSFPGRHELVLRTDAPSGVAVSLSRAQEFVLLRAAAAAGVMVPEPLWLCRDSAVLGKAFYIMRKVEGVALGPKVVRDRSLGGDRAVLAEELGRQLARIHAIRPPREDLAFLPLPGGPPSLRFVEEFRAHLDALQEPRPALEWGLRWLECNALPSGEITLIHQDYRTGNYMIDEHGLTAILDWEFAAWGDPMFDIGWFCAKCWRFGRHDLEAGGIAPRAPFYRGYEAESGRCIDPHAVAYWEVAAHLRWAVIALQQGYRHISGAEASLELALTGRRIAELEMELLTLTSPEKWSQP